MVVDVGTDDDGRVARSASWLEREGRPHVVRGVTYGTFSSRRDGHRYPAPGRVDADFARMAALGLNTVRVYTVPPRDVLDAARAHGLRLVVGLDYDDWRMVDGGGASATRRVLANGLAAVERAMRTCAGRPEVLAVSVGNEVPVDLVRLHGIGRVERCLERLIVAVHDADRAMPVTYTNYPSTEFLDPGGQDVVSWNVFLEERVRFRRYLTHLLALAGERPLLLNEFGLSAGIHGEAAQAEVLRWQLDELATSGAAGGTVFSWTDEWAVADVEVTDWGFGVTRHDRSPKAAADELRRWSTAASAPTASVSVVVCAYNEAANIDACIRSVLANRHPAHEVIVCDDGSEDDTAQRAAHHPVRLLRLPRGGLSAARNAGMRAATGDVVAYLDADAEAGPDWVEQIARAFADPGVVAAGGPNHPFDDAGLVEHAVASSPGNPREVLVADDEAEHVAGCNMAIRRSVLQDLAGFDVSYRTAGDDVDLCWRLLDAGGRIAFAPTAAVRHHRRATVKGYLRQQRGYGRAERMLQGPHRERFNSIGQARWRGVVYGGASLPRRLLGPVVYHGPLGLEPFQPVRGRPGETVLTTTVALLPLCTLGGAALVVAGGIGGSGALAACGAAVAVAPALAVATSAAATARPPRAVRRPVAFRCLVGALHVLQPHARTWGRARTRPLAAAPLSTPLWTGGRLDFVDEVARRARAAGWGVHYGGETDAHDLVVRRGLAEARINLATVWDWVPQWSVRSRPRLVPTAVASAVAGLAGGPPGVALVAGVGGAAAVRSLRRLRREIAEVASGARTAAAPAPALPTIDLTDRALRTDAEEVR